jgi:plastocyanin
VKNSFRLGALATVLAVVGAGCGKPHDPTATPPTPAGAAGTAGAAASAVEEVSGPPGVIKGKVVYKGEPKPGKIEMGKDANCAKMHSEPVVEQWFLGGEGGALGNVIVEISKGPKAWRDAPGPVETKTFLLDQKGCLYHPSVFAIRAGTPFEVKNSDDTDHNVHFYGASNKSGAKDNVAQSKGAPNIKWALANPEEEPVNFKCDVHPWMGAYGRIVGHNWFVVTDKTGTFEFKNVPPGDYTLKAYHERFDAPMVKKNVKVEPSGSAECNFPAFDFNG